MFQITKFTFVDRMYPIEYTSIRIEDILWPRQILRVVFEIRQSERQSGKREIVDSNPSVGKKFFIL